MRSVVLVVVGLVVLVAGCVTVALRPPPAITATPTQERLSRGHYLADHVLNCMHCHSQGDPDRWGQPPKPGTAGVGGNCFDQSFGFPGRVCASNLTPDSETGLGTWTDGEILRAIREGVSKDGHALVVFMPYPYYRELSDEDGMAIIAYLRSLPAVKYRVPDRELTLAENFSVNRDPKPLAGPVPMPDPNNEMAYGQYLATLASCGECHTPVDEHFHAIAGRMYSGGRKFPLPGKAVVMSSNLTPDQSGLGKLTREAFIRRFKSWEDPEVQAATGHISPQQNTTMGWIALSGMTEQDLGAIYTYLQSLPPVVNAVDEWPAAPK